MMKASAVIGVWVLVATVLLSGCGQKGPLYLPGEAPASQAQGPFGLDDNSDSSSTNDADERTRSPLDD